MLAFIGYTSFTFGTSLYVKYSRLVRCKQCSVCWIKIKHHHYRYTLFMLLVPFLLIFAFCLQETKEAQGKDAFCFSPGNQWTLIQLGR
jgi:hypothetical protein